METTSIILAGAGVIKSFYFFFFFMTEEMMNVAVKAEYDKYMKLNEGSGKDKRTQEFIQFIADDKFNEETYKRADNWTYLAALSKLKETFVKFYFKNLDDLKTELIDMKGVNDVYNRIGQYIIQLMRLRKVIEPEVQISKNVHPRTDINYLAIKAYWIDDNGKKVRKFTKSLGRAENYPQGIEDKQALTDGIKLIQPVLFENYKELYTE
jgi:hypothetical protein